MKRFFADIKDVWGDLERLTHALFIVGILSLIISIAFIVISEWRSRAELGIIYGGIRNVRLEAYENDLIVAYPLRGSSELDYNGLLSKARFALLQYRGVKVAEKIDNAKEWQLVKSAAFDNLVDLQLQIFRFDWWFWLLFALSAFFQVLVITFSYQIGRLEYKRRKSKDEIQDGQTENDKAPESEE
ncbi:MAG: hypothetical protein AAB450_02015 [Patescibacteria group bacterium]